MVSVILIAIWIALAIIQIYKWMFHRPNNNFPPGMYQVFPTLVPINSLLIPNTDQRFIRFCFFFGVKVHHDCQFLVHIRTYFY